MVQKMKDTCPRCKYTLHSYVREEGAFRFLVYFDEGREVERCPRCNARFGTSIKPKRTPHNAS